MKRKLFRVLPVFLGGVVMLGVVFGCSGCSTTNVGENKSYYLEDDDVYPAIDAFYEEESKAVISSYNSGDLSAEEAAAQLFAYACYNEEYIDRYVYFSNQIANTSIGSGSGEVVTQNYKLIIREDGEAETDGYKYHYTIKKVNEADGAIKTFKSQFEQARLRFVVDTDQLYRFEADDDTITYETDEDGNATEILTCEWETGSDWGVDDDPIVKREEKLDLEGIEADILARVEEGEAAIIHGNVNILAENIVESATITEGTADGHTVYEIVMQLNTDVANADEASSAMLEDANTPASKCVWTEDEEGNEPTITFQIWDNGLMKYYKMEERWSGSVFAIFSGEAESTLEVWYSYSDQDCDMTDKLAWLEEAKTAKEAA